MSNSWSGIPQDNTSFPGMKTIKGGAAAVGGPYIPDVEYICRDGVSLKLQILMPEFVAPGSTKKYPLVVFVQGAAWMEQNCYMQIPLLCEVSKRGYVVASVKHRPAFAAKFPAFLQDVKSAIRFLRKNAEQYNIDPDRVAIWGDSSGGHTSLMVGTTADMEEFKTEDNREFSDSVSVVVDFYGPTDLAQINNAPRHPDMTKDKDNIPEDILFGGVVMEHPEIAQVGNPINYVTEEKELPPILIMHGDCDSVVPFNQSLLMYEKLTKCEKVVEFYKVTGAGHGEFFWTAETIDTAVKFTDTYIKS
jgi:acetyl esterase/lipase